MSLFYQKHDFELCDYELYRLPHVRDLFRGPRPTDLSNLGRMISFLGAAQTFGVMCRHPFPALVGGMLGREVLNLGMGGAGPRTFMWRARRKILEYVNQTRVCVVQVMSARGEENAMLVNPTGGNKLRYRAASPGAPARPAEKLYAEIIRDYDSDAVLQVVNDTRQNWIASYRALAAEIRVPKILLWISTRPPEYELSTSSLRGVLGAFPQMVNAEMLAAITPSFDRVVVATSPDGMPTPFRSRFTGLPIRIMRHGELITSNRYYPSQHLHMRAAQLLEPCLREYLPPEFAVAD